jgi:hypothetical protein
MDLSLAKGLKNQFFREISDEVDNVIEHWMKYCKESKYGSSRKKWEKFCEGIDKVFGPFLLAKYEGGSKRKPFLCLATFENENRKYNSWNERCLSSSVLYLTYNPVWYDALPMGFSISEHAIQRIFQRLYSDESPTEKDFRKVHFASELCHVPLWATFWVYITTQKFSLINIGTFKIIIPSANGLFLGEIHKGCLCEIRTFIAISQFSLKQRRLHEKMLVVSERFADSVIPFLFHKFITNQSGLMDEFAKFLLATEEISNLLRVDFQIEI